MNADDRRLLTRNIILVIIIGMAIRLIVGTFLKYNFDSYHWALILSNIQSGEGLYDVAGYYYPPVWGYLLGVFSEISTFMGLDAFGDKFTELLYTEIDMVMFGHMAFTTTPLFNFAYTTFLTISDLLVAYMIFWIIREYFGDGRKARVGFTAYFLGIYIIAVCTVGGMFDTFSALITLVSVCLLMKNKDFLAGMMFAMAVLLKLFPGFLILLIIAYLYKKGQDEWKNRLGRFIIGCVLCTIIIMVPQIIDGTVVDSFSFILSRAGQSVESYKVIVKYGAMLLYVGIMILEIIISRTFFRKEHKDIDKEFIWFAFMSLAVVSLCPGTPQYIILMTPFLIIAACCYYKDFWKPFIFQMLGTTLFQLSPLSMELTTATMYTDLMSFDTWSVLYSFFENEVFGFTLFDVWGFFGGVLQYLGTLITMLVLVRLYGLIPKSIRQNKYPPKELEE